VRRRQFIAGLGVALTSRGARAQQPSIPVIGFLNSASHDRYIASLQAFHRGLAESDYVEGRNVIIEYRWAEGRYDRLPAMAADLVRRQVNLISANGPAVPAVKAATSTIPIVFTAGFDPVELGLVTSLNRPGGNLTGVSILNTELGPKRLELLHEVVPNAKVMALLSNSANPNADILSQNLHAGARALGLQLHVLHANTEFDFEPVFTRLAELRVGALVIGNDPFFTTRAELLAALTLRNAMPTIYQYREFAAGGGLMSYGGSLIDTYYKAGLYAGRILKGDKPADLPVQQSTKVELIINLRTAKSLGFAVPLALLARADEVIE